MSKANCVRRFWAVGIILTAVVLVAAACGPGVRELARGELEAPRVSFQGLIIHPPESECWPLGVKLLLDNPNNVPLQLSGYDYEVSLAGSPAVSGRSQDSLTVPALGQSKVEVPVFVKLGAVPRVLAGFLSQKQVPYEVSGGLRLTALAGGLLRVPFHFRGTLTEEQGLEYLRLYTK